MRAADLDDGCEGLRFQPQGAVQGAQGRLEAALDLEDRGYVHRGRKRIIRRLAEIDVIVWINRMFRAARRAEQFIGAIGDDLIEVHVGLRAGPCLPNEQGKLGVEAAAFDFARRRGDRVAERFGQEAELAIDFCGDSLDEGQGADDRDRHCLRANREMNAGALRLRAPIAIGRDVDRAETVRFDSRFSYLFP